MSTAPSRSVLADLEVIVDRSLPVDAGWAGRALVLRDGQTHENAVMRLVKMFPSEHVDDIQRLVRTHMPDAPSLDSLAIQLGASTPKWVTGPAIPQPPSGCSRRRMRLISTLIGSAVGVASLSCYLMLARMQETPLDSPEFETLAAAANFDCRSLDETTAACISKTEQTTWTVTARKGTGPVPDSYRFSNQGRVAVVWIFESEEDRETSPEIEGLQRSYPYTSSRDRVTVSSTDVPVLAALAHAVDKSVLHGVHGKSESTPAADAPRTKPMEAWPSDPAVTPVPWPDPIPRATPQSAPRPEPPEDEGTVSPRPTGIRATAPTPAKTPSSPTGTPVPADGAAQVPDRVVPEDVSDPAVSVTVTVPAGLGG